MIMHVSWRRFVVSASLCLIVAMSGVARAGDVNIIRNPNFGQYSYLDAINKTGKYLSNWTDGSGNKINVIGAPRLGTGEAKMIQSGLPGICVGNLHSQHLCKD